MHVCHQQSPRDDRNASDAELLLLIHSCPILMLLALMKQLIGKLFPACHSMDNTGAHRTGAVVAAPEAAGSPKVDDMGMDLNDCFSTVEWSIRVCSWDFGVVSCYAAECQLVCQHMLKTINVV